MSTISIKTNGLVGDQFRHRWLAAAGQSLQRFDSRGAFAARHDAAESAFTQRALTYVMTEVWPTLIPPLKARMFIPTAVKGNPGDEFLVWRKPTRTGMARLFAPGSAMDLPVVGLMIEEIPQRFYPVGVKLVYDYFELLAIGAALANGQPVDLVGEKLKAALEAIEKKLDVIAAFGTATPPAGYAVEVDADAAPTVGAGAYVRFETDGVSNVKRGVFRETDDGHVVDWRKAVTFKSAAFLAADQLTGGTTKIAEVYVSVSNKL